jgi:mono/diheme cytochrome c family protein
LSSDFVTSTTTISSAPQQQEIDHPGQKIFKANCTPCHRIHQRLVGPALAGVFERRASGDPAAVKLFREYNGTQMTSFTSFSDEGLRNLLEYIKLESAREDKSHPAPSRTEV